jgi:hypothetical protein
MTSRTTRTILAVSASAALFLTAPGFVGVAAAHDRGPSQGWSHSPSTLSPELQKAIKDARLAYFTAAQKAKSDYRDALIKLRTSIQTETADQLKAVQDARSAFDAAAAAGKPATELDGLRATLKARIDAYRTALGTAKTTHQTGIAQAQKAANDAIEAAGTAYTKGVTDAFATFAKGITPPPGLLNPPGHSQSKGSGSGHGDQGLHLDWNKGNSNQNGNSSNDD